MVPTKGAKRRSNFIRFLHFVWPYRMLLVAASVGGIIKFSLPLFVPEVTRHLLDDVYLNPAMSAEQKTQEMFTYVGLLMGAFVLIWIPGTFVRHYYAGKASQKAIFDLRHALYYHILRMSASFFDRNKSGSIVARIIGDVELAQNLIGSALTDVWMDFTSLVLILYFMLKIDVGITLVALVTFPIYLYYFRKSQTEIRASSLRVQEEISVMAGKVQEKITGSRVVHAFTGEETEEESFDEESHRLLSMSMRRVYLQSVNVTITNFLTQLAPLIVTVYGGYQVIQGQLSIGEIVAVGMYLPPLYTPLQRFAQLNLVFANSMAAVDRVFEVIDEAPEIMDRPGAAELKPAEAEGTIAFDHVSFSYTDEPDTVPILRDVSFEIAAGQKVAFVGPSGSGKSTIVSLIPRFYDVDAGHVSIGGHDVRDLQLSSLRRQVGMVLQTPILFSGTIWDNIRYGRPGADDDEIVEAARAANAYDFIQSLPNGFDTEVGENGVFLSGGQRQRITIARAFLKNPRILILDEATSALDTQSERLVQAALERLMEGRTTLIIAHRLSTIEGADSIIVMKNGRVAERGEHDRLLAQNGLYASLYHF